MSSNLKQIFQDNRNDKHLNGKSLGSAVLTSGKRSHFYFRQFLNVPEFGFATRLRVADLLCNSANRLSQSFHPPKLAKLVAVDIVVLPDEAS